MSTTALMPVDPSVSPQQAARVLSIRANLLPQDVSDGRRARRTRAVVLVAVVLVLNLLGAWYWKAATLKADAAAEFDDVTRQVALVQKRQDAYTPLTKIKSSNTLVSGQLAKLTANDLPWQSLLDLVRTTGKDAEAELTELGGSLSQGAADAGAAQLACDDTEIGQISVSGTAKDKKAVAKYIEALLKLKSDGLADPFVSTVTGDDKVAFELTISITPKALDGRFSTSPCKTGGK
jgi:hypothetical protein